MSGIEARLHLASERLADAVGQAPPASNDIDGHLERVATSLQHQLGRTHRMLRMPETVAARMIAGLPDADPSFERFLLPPVLAGLSARELRGPQVEAAAADLVRHWRTAISALGPEGPRTADLVLPPNAWERTVDPGDWSRTSDGGGRAADGVTEESSDADSAEWRIWDSSTRAALRALPVEIPVGSRSAILRGLWAGGAHSIRLASDWSRAAAWIETQDARIRRVHDLRFARAWALSRLGPIHGHASDRVRLAALAFVAWAYRRAGIWPNFTSPDPAIHQRMADARELEVPESEGYWHPWVRAAVESRRLAPQRSGPIAVVDAGPTPQDVMAELERLEGLEEVKGLFQALIDQTELARRRSADGHAAPTPELHIVLVGNPGTGKTTVARLYGRLLRSLGILGSGRFVEKGRGDLVEPFPGRSASLTREAIEEADGGVLFIDEAYSLTELRRGDGDDAGTEVIGELVKQMEDRKDRFALVLAGYQGPMQNFLAANNGLASRLRDPVVLPDLETSALTKILLRQIEDGGYSLEQGARRDIRRRIAALPRGDSFGNAREMQRLLDQFVASLARRFQADPSNVDPNRILIEDIAQPPPGGIDDQAYRDAMTRLNDLTGLTSVKATIREMAATIRLNKALQSDDGLFRSTPLGHLVFTGNPGTGKTSVAQEFGAILRSLGVLRSGHVHSVSNSDLIAQYVGQTGPKVRSEVRQALDGVLFVDEAYSLLPKGYGRGFEDEALATLVEEMERHRHRLVVILAGYPSEMQRLLDANAGLRSRIAQTIEFPDYNRSELRVIAASMVRELGLRVTDTALDAIADAAASSAGRPSFGNARSVRNVVEAARRRHAVRVEDHQGSSDDPLEIGCLTVQDIPRPDPGEEVRIGFHLRED